MPRKTGRVGAAVVGDLIASMRPRPDAAENHADAGGRAGILGGASMRPRPDAAENEVGQADAALHDGRFNEAAARCRGKLLLHAPGPALIERLQ